ncbi:MAG: extracellular solute-binding protein [Elusimicrobia bacterium]|nr:extracellular solute-binding protein [Elusimicrobiota bacterium]
MTGLLLAVLALGVHAEPLKLWHAYRGGEEASLEKSVALFERESGLKVELLALPYDAFGSKLQAAIPHGAGPDVFIFNHERVRQFARMGIVAAVDERLKREEYFPNTLSALEVDGKTYGFPMSLKCLALYANTALVPKAPKDTAELRALLSKLSSASENRFGLAYESGDFYFHAPFLFGFGGELFDAAGRAVFDTAAMAKSLAFVLGLQQERRIPSEASGALVKALFNEGRAAMVISGPWFAGEIAPSVRYAVHPFPKVSESGLPMRPFLGVEAALVSAKSERPEQAAKLARVLSLGEAAVLRATLGGQVPANVSAYDDARVKKDPLVGAFKAAAATATPMPNTLEMARVWEPMKLALRGVLQGGVSPEKAGALADRRYRALYREKPSAASPWPYAVLLLAGLAFGLYRVFGGPKPAGSFWRRHPEAGRAYAYVAPAAAGILVLVLLPFAFGMGISLYHHEGGVYTFVGLANFVDILASRGYRLAEPLSFYFTLAVTLLWAFSNVALHVLIGLSLALLLKDPLLRMKGFYRVLLIIPWAIPNYITALIWRGMFHRQFGAINGLLQALGLEPVSWFTRFSTAFAANLATNTWLGFPFMMVVSLGALQSIPGELYEAAEVDGASSWQQFRRITLPLLKPALLPAVILGSVWTFNMFNIIYLVSGGEPGGATDILVSEAYRWAFQRNEQYGFAAAYSVLIFATLLAWSALTKRASAGAEEALR